MNAAPLPNLQPCRLLTLDGGGAKGFYTLGVLREVEALIDCPLSERFDLIYGTSTGAVIAALLALGRRVNDIHALYKEYVPAVMRPWSRAAKSRALEELASKVFASSRFEDVQTDLGIVSARWDFGTPMIFKSNRAGAHGRNASFVPGFGCSIAQAVQASCSAYPFFNRKIVITQDGDRIELIDGGYCANNPTLYAIADALIALRKDPANVRVVSLGVGVYPEPRTFSWSRLLRRWWPVQLLQKTLSINTLSMDQLRGILFAAVPTVRISDTFAEPEMATDLLEHDLVKLNMLNQRGRQSFARHEAELTQFLL